MSGFTGLWVDDERPMTDEMIENGWCKAPTFHEAVLKLELIEFQVVSLDHDIASFYGNKEMTGYDILMWLAQRKMDGLYVPPEIRIHTANPVGRVNMEAILKQYFPVNPRD